MSDWEFSVRTALKRAKERDLGAVAAREGILGLPLSVRSKKAIRVHAVASEARGKHQRSLQQRRKPLMAEGTTGFADLDLQFAELAPALAV